MASDSESLFSSILRILCAKYPFINRLYLFPRLTLGLARMNRSSVLRELGYQAIREAFHATPPRQIPIRSEGQRVEASEITEHRRVFRIAPNLSRSDSYDSYASFIKYINQQVEKLESDNPVAAGEGLADGRATRAEGNGAPDPRLLEKVPCDDLSRRNSNSMDCEQNHISVGLDIPPTSSSCGRGSAWNFPVTPPGQIQPGADEIMIQTSLELDSVISSPRIIRNVGILNSAGNHFVGEGEKSNYFHTRLNAAKAKKSSPCVFPGISLVSSPSTPPSSPSCDPMRRRWARRTTRISARIEAGSQYKDRNTILDSPTSGSLYTSTNNIPEIPVPAFGQRLEHRELVERHAHQVHKGTNVHNSCDRTRNSTDQTTTPTVIEVQAPAQEQGPVLRNELLWRKTNDWLTNPLPPQRRGMKSSSEVLKPLRKTRLYQSRAEGDPAKHEEATYYLPPVEKTDGEGSKGPPTAICPAPGLTRQENFNPDNWLPPENSAELLITSQHQVSSQDNQAPMDDEQVQQANWGRQ